MNFHLLTTVANFDSVASLNEKEADSKIILQAFNFSSHDQWLFIVSIAGIVILSFTILSVMYRKKREH